MNSAGRVAFADWIRCTPAASVVCWAAVRAEIWVSKSSPESFRAVRTAETEEREEGWANMEFRWSIGS